MSVYQNTSAFNDSKVRSDKLTPCSGMCSLCMEGCPGTCEIGLSAVLGKAMVYPTNTGSNQVASEKPMPIDYSIFNINGHCFGAEGAPADMEKATIFNVGLAPSASAIPSSWQCPSPCPPSSS